MHNCVELSESMCMHDDRVMMRGCAWRVCAWMCVGCAWMCGYTQDVSAARFAYQDDLLREKVENLVDDFDILLLADGVKYGPRYGYAFTHTCAHASLYVHAFTHLCACIRSHTHVCACMAEYLGMK